MKSSISLLTALGVAGGAVGMTLFLGLPVSARTLDFESTPVTDVVAQLNKALGVNIEIKPGVNDERLVTFSVYDVEGPGARLDAINSLANALNADFHKTFVVSKIADESTPSDPVIDIDAPVVFPTTGESIEDAIDRVASVDDASVSFYTPLHGDISFTERQLNTTEAARDLSRESHTMWKAYYAIVPRRHGRGIAEGATVVGYTNGGQPITELPMMTFRVPKKTDMAEDENVAQNQSGEMAGAAAARTARTLNNQQNSNQPYIVGGNQYDNGQGWMNYGTLPGVSDFSGNTGFSSVTSPGGINDFSGNTGFSTVTGPASGGVTIVPGGSTGGYPVVIQQQYGYLPTGVGL